VDRTDDRTGADIRGDVEVDARPPGAGVRFGDRVDRSSAGAHRHALGVADRRRLRRLRVDRRLTLRGRVVQFRREVGDAIEVDPAAAPLDREAGDERRGAGPRRLEESFESRRRVHFENVPRAVTTQQVHAGVIEIEHVGRLPREPRRLLGEVGGEILDFGADGDVRTPLVRRRVPFHRADDTVVDDVRPDVERSLRAGVDELL